MAKQEITNCDRCGFFNVKEPIHIALLINRVPSAAGCGREDDVEERDLCSKCANEFIKYLLKDLSYEKARELVPMVSKRK